MRKYIIFRTQGEDPQWRERKLQHSGSLTWIIAEHWDSSNKSLPEPGYRPPEFFKMDDSDALGGKTHWRVSDWEVVRVETYEHEVGSPYAEYDVVVMCYCQYNPIDAPLQPMPERQVSVESFGGDREAYDRWLRSGEKPTQV